MAYTRTFRDFAGIDVSSEPSEVHDRRFAYAMNVWKDYHNENGEAVETAPGFRVCGTAKSGARVNGLHYALAANGDETVLCHIGDRLIDGKIRGGDIEGVGSSGYLSKLADAQSRSVTHYGKVYIVDGKKYRVWESRMQGGYVENSLTDVAENPYIPITFLNGEGYEQRNMLTPKFIEKYDERYSEHEKEKYTIHEPVPDTTEFLSAEYYATEGETEKEKKTAYLYAYVETTDVAGIYAQFTDADGKILASGDLDDKNAYSVCSDRVSIGGWIPGEGEEGEGGIWYYVKTEDGMYRPVLPITFDAPWRIDDIAPYWWDISDGYVTALNVKAEDEVIIRGEADPAKFAKVGDMKDMLSGNPDFREDTTALSAINGCTLIEEFDGRLFLSGNPKLPNSVFYTHRRHDTGLNDPSYIGAYNYINDGTGSTPITAMISTPTYLIVLKDDVAQGSSAYYHTGQYSPSDDEITVNLQPRVYPREQGVPNVGCVGCAANFLDDPVFLSSRGLEAVGKSQVNLERTLAHRSYFVDAELINEDLRNARFAEWDGYLCILVPGGIMYLADSRQIDSTVHGHRQYEWYKWDGIGVHTVKKRRWRYDNAPIPEGAEYGGSAIVFDGSGGYTNSVPQEITIGDTKIMAVKETRGDDTTEYWFPVSWHGEYTGEDFKQATALLSLDGRLYFGCEDGSICMFLTQERDEKNHRLLPWAYIRERDYIPQYDDEAEEVYRLYTGLGYRSCMATKSDHCGRTNVAKSTEKGTFIIKTKAYPTSRLTVKVKADNGEWTTYYDNSASHVDISNFDFASVAFNTSDSFLITIRERKRKWVEKQIHIEGWCFKSPFGLISATYDFSVAGKVKLR